MIGHDILLIVLGLVVVTGAFWSREQIAGFPRKLPDLTIATFLVVQGAISLGHSLSGALHIENQSAALVLLYLPAAISFSVQRVEPSKRIPARWVWLIVAFLLTVCNLMLSYLPGIPDSSRTSSTMLITIFLALSIIAFKGFHRLLLGLAVIIWIAHLANFSDAAAAGVGVFLGAAVFASSCNLVGAPVRSGFDFELRDLVDAIANPFIILNLSGRIVFASDGFLKLSGFEQRGIMLADACDLFDVPADWHLRVYPPERFKRVRCHLVCKNGDRIAVALWLNEIRKNGRELKNLLCIVYDEREREILENRIKTDSTRFAGFYETSLALTSSLELKDVLRSISQVAENLTRSDACTIFALDHQRQVLRPIYSTEKAYNAEVMNFELPVGQGLTGAVVREAKPRIENYDDDLKLAIQIPGTSEDEESLLSVPLLAKDVVIGALTLYRIGKRRFEEDDIKVLTVFASQAAAIIETSRLYMRLKESEKLYRYSVDLAGDAIFFVDSETGRIMDSNEMARRLLEYSKPELVSMSIWELHPKPEMQVAKALWQDIRKTGRGKLGEIEYLAKDGASVPASINASVITTGEVSFIQWIVRDISEYKTTLEKISFCQRILDRLGEPVLITDIKGRARYANDAFCMLFEIDKKLLESNDINSANLHCPRIEVLRPCLMKLKDRSYLVEDLTITSQQSGMVRKTVSVLPFSDDDGNPKYYVWVFHPPLERSETRKAQQVLSR